MSRQYVRDKLGQFARIQSALTAKRKMLRERLASGEQGASDINAAIKRTYARGARAYAATAEGKAAASARRPDWNPGGSSTKLSHYESSRQSNRAALARKKFGMA